MSTSKLRRRGFSLIELLVVILILTLLMAVALPLYLSSITNSAKTACRANMQSIANAADAWKVRTRAADYSTMTLSSLTTDLGSIPSCPQSGTYSLTFSGTALDVNGTAQTIPSGSFAVKCNFSGHNGFIPGVMSN